MNDLQSNQVFESLLEEMLTEQHPPDLSDRILTAWRQQKSQESVSKASPSATLVTARPVKPGDVASPPANATSLSADAPVQLNRKAQLSYTMSARGRVALSLAACAAVLLIILGVVASRESDRTNTIAEKNSGEANQNSGETGTSVADLRKRQSDAENAATQTLELDDLPFSTPNTLAATNSADAEQHVGVVEKLNPKQVIAELDRRLGQMWIELGVTPGPNYDAEILAQRMSLAITGQEIPTLSPDSSFDRNSLAGEATASMAFARRWSNNFARLWFDRSAVAMDSAGVAEVKRVLAERIVSGGPWNEVILDLLGGELNNRDSVNSVFVGALAGGENHRLVERVGANFLNVNLACIRCHDMGSNKEGYAHNQETYWTLVALFKGIDARNDEERQRFVIDRQAELFVQELGSKPPSVFYDLPNGVLKSADAKLPDGSPWNTDADIPREALARWISKSPDLDRATVNHVWKLVFGRSLVPQVLQTENVALEDRQQLLDFLASQFRAHDHDLRQLVSWVVTSEAFAKQPLALSKSRWLEATDAELESAQLQELVFAAGPSLGRSAEARTLESSLTAVVRWNHPGGASMNATLAQPAANLKEKPTNGRRPQAQGGLEMPSVSFVLHGQQHTVAQRAFIARLLRTERLSWEERVQHVVGLGGTYSANGRVQQLAKDLLEQNSGNARNALLDLLWAVQNSDAG